jgi:hypothetical protein
MHHVSDNNLFIRAHTEDKIYLCNTTGLVVFGIFYIREFIQVVETIPVLSEAFVSIGKTLVISKRMNYVLSKITNQKSTIVSYAKSNTPVNTLFSSLIHSYRGFYGKKELMSQPTAALTTCVLSEMGAIAYGDILLREVDDTTSEIVKYWAAIYRENKESTIKATNLFDSLFTKPNIVFVFPRYHNSEAHNSEASVHPVVLSGVVDLYEFRGYMSGASGASSGTRNLPFLIPPRMYPSTRCLPPELFAKLVLFKAYLNNPHYSDMENAPHYPFQAIDLYGGYSVKPYIVVYEDVSVVRFKAVDGTNVYLMGT